MSHKCPTCGTEVSCLQLVAQSSRQHVTPALSGWQPIETAPKDGTAVLALLKGSDVAHALRFDGLYWRMAWDSYRIREYDGPLCWMPMPPVPEWSQS